MKVLRTLFVVVMVIALLAGCGGAATPARGSRSCGSRPCGRQAAAHRRGDAQCNDRPGLQPVDVVSP